MQLETDAALTNRTARLDKVYIITIDISLTKFAK